MESTPRLYDTLVHVLRQHQNWLDRRHLKTLAWMTVGLMQSGTISLTAWAPYVHSRAVYAQSTCGGLARWLENTGSTCMPSMGPSCNKPWRSGEPRSCIWPWIRRCCGIPIVWCASRSSIVAGPSRSYGQSWNTQAVVSRMRCIKGCWIRWLNGCLCRCPVVFTADRGFADTHLMEHLTGLGWHGRIRIKGSFWIDRQGKRRCKVNRLPLCPGQALFWHHVTITKQGYGPVHLALGRPIDSQEYWFVVSDEPTEVKTFEEYGRRFDIEENFLDDQSNGFQLESSLIRSATP